MTTHDPWMQCGDLNYVMDVEESFRAVVRQAEIVEINECIHMCGIEDIKCTGNMYTWNNKQHGNDSVSKLDPCYG